MSVIWKFGVEVGVGQVVPMPDGAHILSAQMQDDKICIWANVEPNRSNRGRVVHVVGTGWDLDHSGLYVGTVQAGPLVWHVFDGGYCQ